MEEGRIKTFSKKSALMKNVQGSTSYQMLKSIYTLMDDYYLDPLIGLVPVVGDVLTTLTSLPFIFVALFDIGSVPLTLAVIANTLKDSVIGMLPFYIGNILDFFVKSNKENYRLIVGYVEGDEQVREEVRRTAIWSAILIAILLLIAYALISLVGSLISTVWGWIAG